jgi:hypothetical protein
MAWVLRVRKTYSSNSEIEVDIAADADMDAIKQAVTEKAKECWDDVGRELLFSMKARDEAVGPHYTGFAVFLLKEKRRRQPALVAAEESLGSEEEGNDGVELEEGSVDPTETPARKRGRTRLEIGALGVYKQLATFIFNFFNAVGAEDRVRVRAEALQELGETVGAGRIHTIFACESEEEAWNAASTELPDETLQILALQAAQSRRLQLQIQDTKDHLERKLDDMHNAIAPLVGLLQGLGEGERDNIRMTLSGAQEEAAEAADLDAGEYQPMAGRY